MLLLSCICVVYHFLLLAFSHCEITPIYLYSRSVFEPTLAWHAKVRKYNRIMQDGQSEEMMSNTSNGETASSGETESSMNM